jgi:phosphatidate cytidylyltransferase
LFVTRVLTAAALLAAFISALWFLDRSAFAALVAVIVAIAGYEWACLDRTRRAMAIAYGAACALLFAAGIQHAPLAPWICGLAAVFWVVAVPPWLARGFDACPAFLLPAVGVVVLVPAGLAMASLSPLRLLAVLGLVWIADTAAYLAGRAFGRRKLAPAISPGKTWEGAAGALVASVIYAIIWTQFDPGLAALVQGPPGCHISLEPCFCVR